MAVTFQCRLASDVDVRKSIFVLDAEEALNISKINPANVHDMSVFHPPIVQHWDMRARHGTLPTKRALVDSIEKL